MSILLPTHSEVFSAFWSTYRDDPRSFIGKVGIKGAERFCEANLPEELFNEVFAASARIQFGLLFGIPVGDSHYTTFANGIYAAMRVRWCDTCDGAVAAADSDLSFDSSLASRRVDGCSWCQEKLGEAA